MNAGQKTPGVHSYEWKSKRERNRMTKMVLVVDDKVELRTLLKSYLTQEGFEVVQAGSGQEALFVAREAKPDVILLDLMMPEMNGWEFMRAYQREADTPIIVLTARLDENDKVLGLELGADDYVTKPFSLRELTARVRAVLRRVEKQTAEQEVLRAADISLDRAGRALLVAGQPVDLTPSEFDLLCALMTAPGRVFSRLELLERIQGAAYEGYERTIDVHIRNLRTKIEGDPSNPRYIETVYGAGYRFTAEDRFGAANRFSARN
jgi:DNA-binding response OmpR family regulator